MRKYFPKPKAEGNIFPPPGKYILEFTTKGSIFILLHPVPRTKRQRMTQRASIVLFALGLRLRCVNFKHTDAMALYKRLAGPLADCGLYKKDGQPTDKIGSSETIPTKCRHSITAVIRAE